MENDYKEFAAGGLLVLALFGAICLTIITRGQRKKIRELERKKKWKQHSSQF